MDGKHRGHERATPKLPGHLPEQEKEQENGNRMQEDIGEVMAAGVKTEELAIQHVRQRRERMPVTRMSVRECPHDSMRSDTTGYDRISVNVSAIVVIDEVVAERLREDEPRNSAKQNAQARNERRGSARRRLVRVAAHSWTELASTISARKSPSNSASVSAIRRHKAGNNRCDRWR